MQEEKNEQTCSFPHLGKDKGANLAWGVALSASLNPGITVGVLDDLVRDHLQAVPACSTIYHAV